MQKTSRIITTLGITVAVAFLLSGSAIAAEESSPADKAFERFRSLTGTWAGKSTKGWDNEMGVKVIAGDTVVVMTDFESHAGEQMLTTVFRDGEQLVLTHYCIAGNQPRLVASSISEDGREVQFEFRSATNLASRDQGHMDKAIFRFDTLGHFTSKWTWYQEGKEMWLEEIQYVRTDHQPAVPSQDRSHQD